MLTSPRFKASAEYYGPLAIFAKQRRLGPVLITLVAAVVQAIWLCELKHEAEQPPWAAIGTIDPVNRCSGLRDAQFGQSGWGGFSAQVRLDRQFQH